MTDITKPGLVTSEIATKHHIDMIVGCTHTAQSEVIINRRALLVSMAQGSTVAAEPPFREFTFEFEFTFG